MDIEFFTTTDLTLASTLLTLGFNITGIDPSNSKRVVFYFKTTDALDGVIEAYWRKDIKVNPLELAKSRREVLNRIYQGSQEHQPNQLSNNLSREEDKFPR